MARPAPRLLAALGTDAPGPTDAALLARFAADRDAGAFELLVYRHAPLVLRVCRAVLRDRHDAEDAAQAVFLALAHQACTVRGDHLAGWLFRVSRRVAARSARRRPPPTDAIDPDALPAPTTVHALDPAEVGLLHDELARLPESYRAPILLCYFEGLTRAEAARRLGWPAGTVDGRLARAKDRLAGRLVRRGVVPALLAAAVETVPPGFAGAVAQAAVAYSAGTTAGLPTAIVTLVNQETRRTTVDKLAKVVGAALSLGVVAAGLGIAAVGTGPAAQPPEPAKQPGVPAADLSDGAVVRLGSAALRHPDTLTHLRFTADGRHLLTYGHGRLRRWDAKTGAAAPDPAKDIDTAFSTTLLSPDATRVVAPHVNRNPARMSVREYDLATGRHVELFPIPDRRPGGYYGAQRFTLSPDGTLLVEGWGKEAFIWDLKARTVRHHLRFPRPAPQPLAPDRRPLFPDGATWHFVFTPDGHHLMTAGGDDRAVRFWDVASGKETRVVTRENPNQHGVGGLAVSPDGRWLAAADNAYLDGVGTEVAVWDLTADGPPRVVTVPDRFGLGGTLAFGPGGALYVVSDPSRPLATVVTRWDAATGRRVGRWAGPHPGRDGRLVAVVSPDGNALAVGTHGGVVQQYDTRTGAEVARTSSPAAEVIGASFAPDGRVVRTVGADGSIADWDATTGRPVPRRGPNPPPTPVGAAPPVVSPDGRWVVTSAVNPGGPYPAFGPIPSWLVDLRDGATGERKATLGADGPVQELVPIPGGTLVAGLVRLSTGLDARVWDTTTGKVMPWFEAVLDPQRSRHTVTPDGKTFVAVDWEQVTGYDPATGRKRYSWKLADTDVLGRPVPKADRSFAPVRAVAAAPDGKGLALSVAGPAYVDVAMRTDNLVLVEAETGKVIRRATTPETAPTRLVFSPDGRWLAGPRCVWEVATLREVRRFPARPEVTALGFSPDGRRFVTGHVNGTAVVWPVAVD